ncbi:hypothetical protein BG004_006057, partial [Podila humilis]
MADHSLVTAVDAPSPLRLRTTKSPALARRSMVFEKPLQDYGHNGTTNTTSIPCKLQHRPLSLYGSSEFFQKWSAFEMEASGTQDRLGLGNNKAYDSRYANTTTTITANPTTDPTSRSRQLLNGKVGKLVTSFSNPSLRLKGAQEQPTVTTNTMAPVPVVVTSTNNESVSEVVISNNNESTSEFMTSNNNESVSEVVTGNNNESVSEVPNRIRPETTNGLQPNITNAVEIKESSCSQVQLAAPIEQVSESSVVVAMDSKEPDSPSGTAACRRPLYSRKKRVQRDKDETRTRAAARTMCPIGPIARANCLRDYQPGQRLHEVESPHFLSLFFVPGRVNVKNEGLLGAPSLSMQFSPYSPNTPSLYKPVTPREDDDDDDDDSVVEEELEEDETTTGQEQEQEEPEQLHPVHEKLPSMVLDPVSILIWSFDDSTDVVNGGLDSVQTLLPAEVSHHEEGINGGSHFTTVAGPDMRETRPEANAIAALSIAEIEKPVKSEEVVGFASEWQPTASEEQPAVSEEQPAVSEEEPTASEEQPAEQPTESEEQPTESEEIAEKWRLGLSLTDVCSAFMSTPSMNSSSAVLVFPRSSTDDVEEATTAPQDSGPDGQSARVLDEFALTKTNNDPPLSTQLCDGFSLLFTTGEKESLVVVQDAGPTKGQESISESHPTMSEDDVSLLTLTSMSEQSSIGNTSESLFRAQNNKHIPSPTSSTNTESSCLTEPTKATSAATDSTVTTATTTTTTVKSTTKATLSVPASFVRTKAMTTTTTTTTNQSDSKHKEHSSKLLRIDTSRPNKGPQQPQQKPQQAQQTQHQHPKPSTVVATVTPVGGPEHPKDIEIEESDNNMEGQTVVSSKVSRKGTLFAQKIKSIANFHYNTGKKLGKGNFGIVYNGRMLPVVSTLGRTTTGGGGGGGRKFKNQSSSDLKQQSSSSQESSCSGQEGVEVAIKKITRKLP